MIDPPLVLGPMAGVTDRSFRILCKEQGCGLVCTEMVSAKAITYRNKKTDALMQTDPAEHPVSLQLFGSEPETMAAAVHMIEDKEFEILDFNMGCPVPKVVGNGEGSALMKNPSLAGKVIEALVQASGKPPVTVKITEKIGYKETIRYQTETTKDDTMYEGDEIVAQEGKNGRKEISARIVTVNGKTINTDVLSENITKKPVTKKVTVGTKERPPTVGDGKFSCPIHDRFHKTTGFQMRWGRFHKGVDLACPTGTPVYAADGGTVVTASYKPSYGNLVEIDHQNGYLTKYAHNSKILVNVGDKVYEGQKIALVGSTGNSTGPHCHFEVRFHDEPKNPLNFITLSH